MLRDDAVLRDQFAPKLPAESAEAARRINDAVARADALARTDMRRVLGERGWQGIDDSETAAAAAKDLGLDRFDVAITGASAQRLKAVSGADHAVRFRISDYGATPKAWRKAYIAFEVVSTLTIAAIAYAHPATRPIAGVYLVEEAVEETAEGYAGFWALNEVCRPVRVEAELIDLDSGNRVWKGARTGFSDIKVSRVWRHVDGVEQDTQRANALSEAVDELAEDIVRAFSALDTR